MELAQASVGHAQARGDPLAESMALVTLGNALSLRDATGCCEAWERARDLARQAYAPWWQMCATNNLFYEAIDQDDLERAGVEHRAQVALVEQYGPCLMFDPDDLEARLKWGRGNVDDMRRRLSVSLEGWEQVDSGVDGALLLAAELAEHDGDPRRSAVLIAAAHAEASRSACRPGGIGGSAGSKRPSPTSSPPRKWADASVEGRAMSRAEAVRLALESTRPSAG